MGKFSQYKIQLASLPDGKYTQEFECGTEFFKNMEKPEVLDSDVKVHLDMEKRNGIYQCVFTCKGMIHIPCDRCLDPMEHEVDTEWRVNVRYGEDYSDEADDLLVIPYSDRDLNVAYMLADTILLTIPLRHVHAPGKCNRAMAAVLHRHSPADPEAELDNDAETQECCDADEE